MVTGLTEQVGVDDLVEDLGEPGRREVEEEARVKHLVHKLALSHTHS